MELHRSGHDVNVLDSIYRTLVSMSKSHVRSQMLRAIRALVGLGDIIESTKQSDILLELSDSDDWYVAENALNALKRLSK